MKLVVVLFSIFFIVALAIQILGLMQIIPIYISSPLLFITILSFIIYLNDRNRFRGV